MRGDRQWGRGPDFGFVLYGEGHDYGNHRRGRTSFLADRSGGTPLAGRGIGRTAIPGFNTRRTEKAYANPLAHYTIHITNFKRGWHLYGYLRGRLWGEAEVEDALGRYALFSNILHSLI